MYLLFIGETSYIYIEIFCTWILTDTNIHLEVICEIIKMQWLQKCTKTESYIYIYIFVNIITHISLVSLSSFGERKKHHNP